MKNNFGIPVAVIILVAMGMAGGIAKTLFQESSAPVPPAVCGFRVSQPALRPFSRTRVQVTAGEDNSLSYLWKAEAGELSARDTNPVVWTAPASQGRYKIRVEVTNAAGARSSGTAVILVSKYPGNPLVMSVDPTDCNEAKR